MFHLFFHTEKPCRIRRLDGLTRHSQGSVAVLLIFVAFIMFLLLPLTTTLLHQLHSWVLLQRATQTIDQILPSIHFCLDENDLSEGRLSLDAVQARNWLQSQLADYDDGVSGERLFIESVQIQMVKVDPAKISDGASDLNQHWPIVTCHAVYTDAYGEKNNIRRSVAVVLSGGHD